MVILAISFFFLGKAANFMIFAMIFMYLVIKSEETNAFKYYAGIGLGVAAMFIEYEKYYGMAIFNLLSCILIGLSYLGFVELWYGINKSESQNLGQGGYTVACL